MLLRGWPIILALLFALPVSPAVRADVIKYVDETGAVHFTDYPVNRPYSVYIKEKARKPGPRREDWNSIKLEVRKAGNKHGVDEDLIRSVIQAESGYNPEAVSKAGARGLMQLMPETAARYKVKNACNPAQNIDGGTNYLKHLLKKYNGNKKLALAAYNAGEAAVAEYSGIPPYMETKTYVSRVLDLYNKFSGKGDAVLERTVIYRYVDESGTLILTDTPRRAVRYR